MKISQNETSSGARGPVGLSAGAQDCKESRGKWGESKPKRVGEEPLMDSVPDKASLRGG